MPDVFDIARQPRASDGGESSIEVITLRLKENTISHPPLLRITASPISGDDGPSETQHIVLIKNSPINIFPTLISVQDLEEITVKAIISENLEGSELRLFARDESGSEILGQASQITKRLYSIRIPIKSVKGNKVFVSISQIGMEPLKEQEITLVRR